ncbi:MAG TPA: SH3 domain-containing protein, partial [candidate division Zixibacteria bacterium]|nr:SH3 domain-containing protein [candidate division Zixibacteria bacterium]
MECAWVTTNILDMRAEPDHRAERVNQLLFADLVSWSAEKRGFAYVRRWDGYRGWADRRFLASLSERRAVAYSRRPAAVVTALQSRLLDFDGRPLPPHLLYYGTIVALDRLEARRLILVAPDGSRLCVKASSVRPIKEYNRGPLTGRDLVREAGRLVGVPYLWGGITAAG